MNTQSHKNIENGAVLELIRVKEAEYMKNYELKITFDNGVTKIADLSPYLTGPVFEPLKDPLLFRQVFIPADSPTIEWPNGADFAPDTLYTIGRTVM